MFDVSRFLSLKNPSAGDAKVGFSAEPVGSYTFYFEYLNTLGSAVGAPHVQVTDQAVIDLFSGATNFGTQIVDLYQSIADPNIIIGILPPYE